MLLQIVKYENEYVNLTGANKSQQITRKKIKLPNWLVACVKITQPASFNF